MIAVSLRIVRWNEWAYSKIPPLFAVAYSWMILQSLHFEWAAARFIGWILFSALYLAYGYAVNDFFDSEADNRAGKPNSIGKVHTGAAVACLIAMICAGVAVLIPFYRDRWVVPIVILGYLLATAYSMPPLRFKERGIAGLLVASIAQRLVPMLVGMALFSTFDWSAWVLALLLTLIGIRWIMLHQLIDLENDERANVNTFTRSRGFNRTLQLMRTTIFPLEILCLFGWFILAAIKEPALLLIIPLYGLWLLIRLALWRDRGLAFNWTAYWLHPLGDFYEIFLPMFLGAVLAAREPIYVLLFLSQIAWQSPYLCRQALLLKYLVQVRSRKSTYWQIKT